MALFTVFSSAANPKRDCSAPLAARIVATRSKAVVIAETVTAASPRDVTEESEITPTPVVESVRLRARMVIVEPPSSVTPTLPGLPPDATVAGFENDAASLGPSDVRLARYEEIAFLFTREATANGNRTVINHLLLVRDIPVLISLDGISEGFRVDLTSRFLSSAGLESILANKDLVSGILLIFSNYAFNNFI